MRNQLKNIFNSTTSEISMLLIICCLILTTLLNLYEGKWNDIAVISSLIGGVVLFYLLIWATCKLITKKEIKEMLPKPRLIVESISRLLFMYWLYITAGLTVALIWAVLIIWDGIREIKQLNSSKN